jgi:PiT family inorganic phosphate transporter
MIRARREEDGSGVDAAFVLAVMATLAFAFTNGFHDAANAIATLVATRGARPGAAILLAAACNLLGPLLLGAAVADTIAGIVHVMAAQTVVVVGAALTAAVTWNLVTWWRGLPSSSSHALVGGLTGAALVEAGAEAVNWGGVSGGHPTGVIGAWWRWRSRRSSGSVRPGRWNVACAVGCAGPPPAPTGRCCGHSG